MMHQRIISVNTPSHNACVHSYRQEADPREIIAKLLPLRGFRSVRALAIAAGVSQPTLSRYMAGITKDMDLANFRAIAHALDVTMAQLLGEASLFEDDRVGNVVRAMGQLNDAGKDALIATANALAKTLGDDT